MRLYYNNKTYFFNHQKSLEKPTRQYAVQFLPKQCQKCQNDNNYSKWPKNRQTYFEVVKNE